MNSNRYLQTSKSGLYRKQDTATARAHDHQDRYSHCPSRPTPPRPLRAFDVYPAMGDRDDVALVDIYDYLMKVGSAGSSYGLS